MLTTPTKPLASEVRRFCAEVESGEPVFVPVRTASWAEPDECYAAIERQVAEQGGELVYGWTIWFDPRVFIEAEFHAVWRSPAGELMDLSVKPDGETSILFLPSAKRFEGHFIPNVRKPLVDSAANRQRMALAEGMDGLKRKCWVPGGRLHIPMGEIETLHANLAMADGFAVATAPLRSSPRVGRNDPCSCGSGRKAKKCCAA